MKRDRLLALKPLLEIVALEHAGDVVARGEPDEALGAELAEPLAVEADLGLLGIQDLEALPLVGLGVLLDLLPGQGRPGRGASAGIADQPREIADQEDHPVPQVLEVPHLAQQHGVAEVDVGRRGVEADLDHERPPGLARAVELLAQLVLDDDVDGPPLEQLQLLVGRGELDPGLSVGIRQGFLYSGEPAGRPRGFYPGGLGNARPASVSGRAGT